MEGDIHFIQRQTDRHDDDDDDDDDNDDVLTCAQKLAVKPA